MTRWLRLLALVLLIWPAVAAATDVASSIQSIVQSRRHPDLQWANLQDVRTSLDVAYLDSAFAPLWIRDGQPTEQAWAVVSELALAEERGLRSSDYDAALLGERLAGSLSTPEDIARVDTAVTAATLRFIRHTYAGRVNPRRVGFGVDAQRKLMDLPAILRRIVRARDARGLLQRLNPPLPLFRRLEQALADYRALAAQPPPPAIAGIDRLRPGERHRAVDAIRAQLRLLGDLAADAAVPADANRYDPTLVEAIKRFQARHGLGSDGIVGPATLAALQVPINERRAQIELSLERLRWLPRRPPRGRHIVVNIPEFELKAYENGDPTPVVVSDVVVGSAARRNETPMVAADMRFVVFRPYWHVPASITEKEILPKLAEDPSYLERQDMFFVRGRLRQRPGRNNSLGLIKFLFPNRYHVYLHDTPSKSLFGRARRDFSHGCIRVATPVELAEWVLRSEGEWPRERVVEAMQSGNDNRYVELSQPIPVFVLYLTAKVEPDGVLHFLPDIYEHDSGLKKVLDKEPPYP